MNTTASPHRRSDDRGHDAAARVWCIRLVVTGLAQVMFPDKANGQLIARAGGRVVGSRIIGQTFTSPGYFRWPAVGRRRRLRCRELRRAPISARRTRS